MTVKEDYQEKIFPITNDRISLEGDLVIPLQAEGLVILIHSTSGGRYSQSNHHLAAVLHRAGLATLTINLSTLHEEAGDRHNKYLLFNANLLAERLGGATDWLTLNPATQGLRMGYFGMGIEAGAALLAAAEKPSRVGAIACLGGRLDLANAVLSSIETPILLLIDEEDSRAQRINQNALEKIHAEKQLQLITGAAQMNENLAALDEVVTLTAQWFKQYLVPAQLRTEAQLWSPVRQDNQSTNTINNRVDKMRDTGLCMT
jgi:putative phosphoribosyl transferase